MAPCYCGAIDCPDCGPAQGYELCEQHRRANCEVCTCDQCGEFWDDCACGLRSVDDDHTDR